MCYTGCERSFARTYRGRPAFLQSRGGRCIHSARAKWADPQREWDRASRTRQGGWEGAAMTTSPSVLKPEEADHFRQRLEQEATRLREIMASLERGLDSPDQDANEDRSSAMDEDAASELTTQEQYGSQ